MNVLRLSFLLLVVGMASCDLFVLNLHAKSVDKFVNSLKYTAPDALLMSEYRIDTNESLTPDAITMFVRSRSEDNDTNNVLADMHDDYSYNATEYDQIINE